MLGGDQVHRHGEHRLERAGDRSGAVAGGRPQDSHWERLVCGSDGVPEDGGGRPPDAPKNTRQSKELQTGVRQASAGSWCAKSTGQGQRRSLRNVNPRVADTHRALMVVSEMNDMGHDVFFHKGHRGIKAYAYHEGSGTKLELERVNGVSSLSRTVRALRRTAMQEHTPHFRR